MIIIGDIGNTDTKICIINSNYKIIKRILLPTKKINQIQSELDQKLKEVYSNLNSWQTTLVERHEDRPKSKFFIENLFKKIS